MKKIDIIYLIVMGNLLINVPIYLFAWYELFSDNGRFTVFNFIYVVFMAYAYWATTIPIYKLVSVEQLKTKENYLFWKKWSILTLLFWEDRGSSKTECWSKSKLRLYKKKQRELISNNYNI